MAEIYINEDRRLRTKENRNKKRKRRKRGGVRKPVLIMGVVLILLSIIFVIFPKLGVYAYFFDRGDYDESLKDSTEQIREISELTPHTQKLCKEFLNRCENAGLPVIITETYRSQKRQDELFKQGRETDGPVVTWTKNIAIQKGVRLILQNADRTHMETKNFSENVQRLEKKLD